MFHPPTVNSNWEIAGTKLSRKTTKSETSKNRQNYIFFEIFKNNLARHSFGIYSIQLWSFIHLQWTLTEISPGQTHLDGRTDRQTDGHGAFLYPPPQLGRRGIINNAGISFRQRECRFRWRYRTKMHLWSDDRIMIHEKNIWATGISVRPLVYVYLMTRWPSALKSWSRTLYNRYKVYYMCPSFWLAIK